VLGSAYNSIGLKVQMYEFETDCFSPRNMTMTVFTISIVVAAMIVVFGALSLALLSVGMQEADDPSETRPEDLTGYEKRHVHRADMRQIH
jgi:hypothetical protein